jgi:hypothetical protein
MFEMRAQEIAESIVVRKSRTEQRDLAVASARRQSAAGSRLPA